MAGEEENPPIQGEFNHPSLEGAYDPYRSFFEGTLHEVTSLEAVYNEQGYLEDLVIRDIHPPFTRETGIQPEQAIGKRITQVFGSDDILTPYRKVVVETLDTGNLHQLEVYFPPLDKHYQVMLVPLNRSLFVALAYDISVQKRAVEALRENEALFRLALANSSITVFTMDCDLRYTWIYNPSSVLTIEEMIGKRDDEIFNSESAAIVVEPKRQVLATRKGLRRELAFSIRGIPVVNELILEPLQNKAGKMIGLTGVSIDITEKRLLETRNIEFAARMEVQRRLNKQREQERVQIARDLHDGPLQDLIGVTFAIKQLLASNKARPVAEELHGIFFTVQKLVQELRFFASELRPPVLAKFGLAKAVRAHAAVLRKNHPGLSFHLDLEEETSPLPENLRLALYRIYQEAVSNIARHAQAKDVWITFRMEPAGPYGSRMTALEVRDNGIGFRLPDRWIDLARQGHLGLVGMRERAEAAGGTFQIFSSLGEGTTLRVSIPAPED